MRRAGAAALLALGLLLPAAGQPLAVKVESLPPGARIYDFRYREGREEGFLGITPAELHLDRRTGAVLYLVKPGYARERVRLEPGQPFLRVELQPVTLATILSHSFRYRPALAWPVAAALALGLAAGLGALGRSRQRLRQRLARADEKDPTLVGRVLGGYRVLEVVGQGTFAEVLRVEHVRYRDVCVMKILKPDALDEDTRRRFAREMEVGRSLVHPNLVRVFGVGEYRGRPYLIMEFVAGRTLRQEMDQGRLAPDRAREIMRQMARGLAFAHSRGVVHRDLKPENIMLGDDGVVRIMDFGVARLLDRQRLTATGVSLGTPLYMSPEHLDAKAVDQRSDLYSLGVIFYEMLTGQVPFPGEDVFQVISGHLSRQPPRPCSLDPAVDPALETLVLRMLAKNPQDRPQSAEEVLAALDGSPR